MEIIAEIQSNDIVALAITTTSSLKNSNTKSSIKDVCVDPLEPESTLNSGTNEEREISSKDAETTIKNCNFKRSFR